MITAEHLAPDSLISMKLTICSRRNSHSLRIPECYNNRDAVPHSIIYHLQSPDSSINYINYCDSIKPRSINCNPDYSDYSCLDRSIHGHKGQHFNCVSAAFNRHQLHRRYCRVNSHSIYLCAMHNHTSRRRLWL